MQVTIVAALLSLAALSSAQDVGGIGRFQCSTRVGGVNVPNQDLCSDANIQTLITDNLCKPSGDIAVTGLKSDGAYPSGAACFARELGGVAYCGIAGATCTTDANCDNGQCQGGVCTGDFGFACTSDAVCTGNLACSSASVGDFQPSCGYTFTNPSGTPDEDLEGGSYCADYCAAGSFLCEGDALCDTTSTANLANGGCYRVLDGPSQRARSRRDVGAVRSRTRCLAPNSVCPTTSGVAGFECVDTTSNLEQCGACAASGGVDCTALPGVDAVGCVAGQCEIWACAESFMWDAATSSCTPALVA